MRKLADAPCHLEGQDFYQLFFAKSHLYLTRSISESHLESNSCLMPSISLEIFCKANCFFLLENLLILRM